VRWSRTRRSARAPRPPEQAHGRNPRFTES
jgi:hypothetical protein